MSNTLLISAPGTRPRWERLRRCHRIAWPDRNPPRKPATRRSSDGSPGRPDLGSGMADVQKAVADLHLPSSIRVEYGGTYQEQQQSFHDLVIVLVLAIVLVFIVLLFEFRTFAAPVAILSSALLSTSGVFIALLITRTTFNICVVHGDDHGHRHRGQKWHSAARRRSKNDCAGDVRGRPQ